MTLIPRVVGAAMLACLCGIPSISNSDEQPKSYQGFGSRFRGGGRYVGAEPVLLFDRKSVICGSANDNAFYLLSLSVKERHVEVIRKSETYLGTPDIDPTGKKIAYVSENSDGLPAIWISDIDGRNARRLTQSQFPEDNPVFSKDGKSLAIVRRFSREERNLHDSELVILDIDGKHERRLTNDRCVDRPIRFSSDGRSLYFSSERNPDDLQDPQSQAHLYKVDLKDQSIVCVLRLGLRSVGPCDLSYDEMTLVYVDDPNKDFAYDVFSCGIDGSNKQQRTKFGGYIGGVRFGFNPGQFTFLVEPKRSGVGDIYLYDLSTSTMKKVGTNLSPEKPVP